MVNGLQATVPRYMGQYFCTRLRALPLSAINLGILESGTQTRWNILYGDWSIYDIWWTNNMDHLLRMI